MQTLAPTGTALVHTWWAHFKSGPTMPGQADGVNSDVGGASRGPCSRVLFPVPGDEQEHMSRRRRQRNVELRMSALAEVVRTHASQMFTLYGKRP